MKKFKRLIAIVTVLLFALSIVAPALAQDEAAASSVYDDAAKILKDKGVMVGNESGDLMLDKQLTRAEILKMIIKSTGQDDVVQDYVYAEQSFKDVPNTHWAFAYVEAGKDLGIVNGYPDGTFKPDQPVKFEELCKMLVAAKGESPASGKWPVNYVRKALDLGYFTQIEDEVGIGDYVIRGQAAVAFANAFFPPEKTIAIKDVKALANDSIQVAVNVYLNGEPATLEDGDIMPMDITIKDASDASKTLAVTAIDTDKSDFANGIVVFKTDAQTAGANYKVFYKDQDTNLTFAGVALPLQVTKVEALNYKEIKVTFNRAVDNATYATTTGNYTVKVGTATTSVSNVNLAADKTSAILLLADTFSNNDTVTVTVSKNLGMAQDYTATISNFIDTTAPVVENVAGSGLMKIIVTFSEPVKGANVPTNYKIDGSYLVSKEPSIDSTGRVATITFYTPLSAGTHTVEFSGITDYAGYGLVTPIKTFAMSADNSPLTVSVASATQTSVTLNFNKDVSEVDVTSISPSSWNGITIDWLENENDYNGNSVTLYFNSDAALPTSGATLSLYVIDSSGNSSTQTVSVVPTVDLVRPAYVSYTVDSQNSSSTTLVLTFSENIKNQGGNYFGTFELKDSDGIIYSPITNGVSYYKDPSTGDDVKNKLSITFPVTSSGNYTLSISNVVDDTPLRNIIIPTTVNIAISDKIAPSISAAYVDGYKYYIVFNDKVTATTALNPSNYTLVQGNTAKLVSSVSSAKLSLAADGKTVCIDFSNDPQVGYTKVIAANISDLSGNIGTSYYDGVQSKPNAPQITNVKLTGSRTIEVTVDRILTTVSPSDFIVFYNYDSTNNTTGNNTTDNTADDVIAAYISSVSYDGANTIKLTLSRDLKTDVTDSTRGLQVYMKLNANPTSVDAFGQPIRFADDTETSSTPWLVYKNSQNAIYDAAIIDACAPTVSVTSGSNLGHQIKIEFSEIVNITSLSDAIKVVSGLQTGDNAVVTVDSSNSKIYYIDGLTRGRTYTVRFDNTKITDTNNNQMGYMNDINVVAGY